MSRCNCKSPPGGGVECNPNQMAVCRLINGECISQCIDVPAAIIKAISRDGFTQPGVQLWLAATLGVQAKPGFFSVGSPLKINPDGSGMIITPGSRDMVRFSLPALAQEESGAGAGAEY